MRNKVEITNTGSGFQNWPSGATRYAAHENGYVEGVTARVQLTDMSCAEFVAWFNALTPNQKLACTSASAPAANATKHWEDSACGQYETEVVVDDEEYFVTQTGGGGQPSGDGFDFSYTFSRAGADFAGHNFISTPAPILTAVTQSKPRPRGNNFAFAPQNALNTTIHGRLPVVALHSSKITIYPGGLFSNTDDNNLIGRGWTHVSESTKWIPGQDYPTNLHRAIEMANYQAAYDAAMALPGGDARRQKLLDWAGPLPAFEGTHLFIDDESACQLYAQKWYLLFKQNDWKGAGIDYFSVNHEVYVARNPANYYYEWYRQVGWITKHIIATALADGKTLKSGMTDFGNLSHVSPFFFDDNDGATGFPRYMSYTYIHEPYRGSSQADPIGGSSDIGALVLAGKAFVGVGRYMQHTTDGQSLFQKNVVGTLQTDTNGDPIWRTDKRSATVTGQATVIYKDDNFMAMLKRYSYEASDYANWFFRAGSVHLPMSNARKAGYENIRFSGQFRLDTESDTGNSNLAPGYNGLTQAEFDMLNSRPLYPNWVEGNAIRMYLNEDYIRGWMETQNVTDLGADNGKDSKARASAELYAKGFQRAAALNWIFDTPYQLIEPKLWLKNQGIVSNASADEHFARKPILRGGIAMYQNRRTIWMRGEWPCQDEDRVTSVLLWVKKGSTLSPAYEMLLDGRRTFLDYWQLPEGFPDFESKDVYLQFKSLLDEKITWRGDYREAKITDHPTPPALA